MEWLVSIILKVILARLEKAAATSILKIEEAKKRGEVDAENVASYNAAKDRAEKIKASLDLLNGTHSS
jgi:hypothetical protein